MTRPLRVLTILRAVPARAPSILAVGALAAAAAGLGGGAACGSPQPDEPIGTTTSSLSGSSDAGTIAAVTTDAETTAAVTTLWSFSFEESAGLPAGNAHSLAAIAPPLALSRASRATVQTSGSTVDTTPGIDDARIGATGAVQGLVIEEERTNYNLWARNAANWPWIQAGTIPTAGYGPGPDGSESGTRIQIEANPANSSLTGIIGWVNVVEGAQFTFSQWLRSTNGPQGTDGPIVQWGACDNNYRPVWADPAPTIEWGRSVLSPVTQTGILNVYPAMAPAFSVLWFCGAFTNTPQLAVDQVVDLMQGELGLFSTEAIITTGSPATRAGDHLEITNGAAIVGNGQLSLSLKMYPKGDALSYTSPAYLWYIDPGNYARFEPRTQGVTLAVAGQTASSAPAAASAPPLFAAQQAVEWQIVAGGGAGRVQYRLDGGPLVTLLDQPLAGALAPTGAIDLLSAGTGNQFSCWLGDVAAYCGAPNTACSGACVNTQTDVRNCGGCGNVCAGTCTSGRCATPLATGQYEPFGIAIDQEHVYWTNNYNGTVMQVPIGGGSVTTLAAGQGHPEFIAVDATNVYWTSGTNVLALALESGNTTTLASAQDAPLGITSNGIQAYWANEGSYAGAFKDGTIQQISIAAGATPSSFVTAQYAPALLATDANNLYWADLGARAILQAPIAGGAATTLVSGALVGSPKGIAVGASGVYWTNGVSAGTVLAVPVGGGAVTTLAAGQSFPYGVTVDATNVYWTNSGDGTVMAVALSGGTPTTLASGQGTPEGIVVDATNAYWITHGNLTFNGMVVTTPKN